MDTNTQVTEQKEQPETKNQTPVQAHDAPLTPILNTQTPNDLVDVLQRMQASGMTPVLIVANTATIPVPAAALSMTPNVMAPVETPSTSVESTPVKRTRKTRGRVEQTRRNIQATATRRGRIASKYLATATEPDQETLTESVKRVWALIKASKRGRTARNMSLRLDMPLGTVGWAVNQLAKQGSVKTESSGSSG